MLNCTTCEGDLEIDGVPMRTPAWCVTSLLSLWETGEVRGQDRLLPGVVGVRAYPRRLTVKRHSLPMLVTGEVDEAGVAYADVWEGLEANLDFLRANVTDPTNLGDGTRPAVLTMPSGATRTADIHVLGLALGKALAGVVRATLEISIPGGVFV